MSSATRRPAAAISVVTGAAGFLGLALVRRLLADGDSVRAVVLANDPHRRALDALRTAPGQLTVVAGDVTDAPSIAPAFPGATRVFHTAAMVHAWAPWERFYAVNVGGTQAVARLAREANIERFVLVSTSDVFGLPDGTRVIEEADPLREWGEPYADTKIAAERWMRSFAAETGLPLTTIYPGWIYGPGDRAFFPSLADAIRRGAMFFWHRGARLPWAYIDNMVDACVLAAAHPAAAGEGYLVHDAGDGPTLEEVCARIAAALDAPPPRRHVPYALAYAVAATSQVIWRLTRLRGAPPLTTADVKAFGQQFYLSSDKIRRQLGWRPRIGVEEGMQSAVTALRTAAAAPATTT